VLKDTVLMAIEEINAKGGVLGKKLEPVVVDPASNWPLFAEKAKQLIVQDKVAVTFGCWTSVSRKSALPVFEGKYTKAENPYGGGLLFYPVQYEGEEQSYNVFYTGASPNQQLIPAAEYMMSADGGSKKKFYLLGTDYVFPRTANKVLKAFLIKKGVPEANIAEEYTPFGHSDYQTIVGKIRDFAKDGDACVLSTINGDSNVPFYTEFANQGLTADGCPIMAFSVAEDELRSMQTEKLVGHLAAWNYFQSIDTPENKRFVQKFKDYCKKTNLPGGANRVTDDPIEAAYFGVHVWKAAAEKAGTFDIHKVIPAVLGMEFDAPGGRKKMDEVNHHTYKPVLIGSIRADGQFDIVTQTDLVKPDSFSTYLHSPEQIKKLTAAK
jgi:urea transport system substrate-binding protein